MSRRQRGQPTLLLGPSPTDPAADPTSPTAPPAPTPDTVEAPAWPSERVALWVFVGYLIAAVPVLLWLGSYRWFLGDEWTFLTDRSMAVDDLFRPNNQHWSTTLTIFYRGLYSLFGLHAYWPYQLVVILMHLGTAALLRVAMRRARVGPWLATVAAGTFVLLGSAEDNILWAIQIGLTTTVVLGLGQMLLADHDGPIDHRDWWGLGLGALALISSGNAPPLIVAAGLVCLLRRRWRAAAFHTVPLGLAYLVWFLVYDVKASLDDATRFASVPFSIQEYGRWMLDAVEGVALGLGHFTLIGLALAALLIGGTVVAWRDEGSRAFLGRAAVPTALLVAAILAMTSAAPGRYFLDGEPAKAARYVGLMASFILPALAVAGDAVMRRWRVSTPVVFALFLIPVPWNATAFGGDAFLTEEMYDLLQLNLGALAEDPLVEQVPPWVRPNESLLGYPDMTTGWLLQADRNGEIPAPDEPMHPLTAQLVPLQLGVATIDGDRPEGLACATHTEPLPLDPSVGDRFYLATDVQLAGRVGEDAGTLWLPFTPTLVEITLPDLHLLLAPAVGETEFQICR